MRRQLESCLTSDLLEEAKLAWVFLIACRPGGCGAEGMAKALGISDIDTALNVLKDEGLATFKVLHHGGGVWRPVKYATGKGPPSKAKDQPVSLGKKSIEFMKTYQRLRKAALGRELTVNASTVKHFDSIAAWLEQRSVRAVDFMRFAIDRTDWLEDKMPFPTPGFLAGPWIRDQWEDARASGATSSGRKGAKHAGTSYGDVDEGTRATLEAAGLDVTGLKEADIRYIESCAATARELGEIVGVDDSMIPYIECLLEGDK